MRAPEQPLWSIHWFISPSLYSPPLPKHRFPVLLHRVGAPEAMVRPHFPLKPQFPLLIHRVGAPLPLPFLLKHQFPLLIYRAGAPLYPPFPLKPQLPLLLCWVGASLHLPFPLKPQFPLLIHKVGAPLPLPFPLKHQFPPLLCRVGAPFHPPFPLKHQFPLLIHIVGAPLHRLSLWVLEECSLMAGWRGRVFFTLRFTKRCWVWPVWRPAVGFALLPFSFFLLLPFLPPFHPFLRYYLSKFNCFSLINIEVIIALKYCVGFCHTSAWISHGCMYVPSLLNLPSTSQPIPPVL